MTLDLEPYRIWLSSNYGLDTAVTGETALRNVVSQRMRILGLDAAGYEAFWRSALEEKKWLLEATLVGETWFFRERAAFERLADGCAWFRARGGVEYPLRVLVLPCATGEEAWSVAAVLRAEGYDAKTAVVEAIDLHSGFIESALKGLYSIRRLRDDQLDARWLKALGTFEGDQLTIDPNLFELVRFSVGNALDPSLLELKADYDVVFCRNLLIYLHAEARQDLLQRLTAKLRPDGLLFLGHAEHLPEQMGFMPSQNTGAFVWNKGDPEPPCSRQNAGAAPLSSQFLLKMQSRNQSGASKAALKASLPCPAPPEDPRRLADQGALEPALKVLIDQGLDASLRASDHGLAGVLLEALGRREEAIGRFRRALYLDPDHAESLAHLALLLEQLGRHDEASRLRRRLTLLPD